MSDRLNRELIEINEQLRRELEECRQAQTALEASQSRLAGILEIAEDAIISVDATQRITLFNQGAENIFGYSAQTILGKPLDLLLPLNCIKAHRQHILNFAQSADKARRMGERRQIFARHQDGREFPAEASISQLEIGGEKIFTVILRDITHRQLIECLKNEFIAVVSHEIRTPLTSIYGSLEMLADGLLDGEPETRKRLLEIAVDSTERLVRLVNDVLDVEKIDAGKLILEKQPCQAAELMLKALSVMQPIAEKFGITLSVSTISTVIWVDSDRLIQILTNLLSNAIKFSPPGATVWLSAENQGSYLLFQIKDRGRGIPSDKLEAIFERFHQVDASDARNHEGTGLGLAICRSLVEQHGGQIWVESILGEGSIFFFTLPI